MDNKYPDFRYISKSEEDTAALGRKLAHMAEKTDVFALFGTLGMGKSVFARAFIQELIGKKEEVPSPTFTLVQSYPTKKFEVYHYDLYRIKKPEEIFELGIEEAMYDGVCLIEWPEKMGAFLPRDIFRVEIIPAGDSREIKIYSTIPSKKDRLKELANE
jgi:tRNA threonylcarbamoyladenosine biosynthesis protein TsaE